MGVLVVCKLFLRFVCIYNSYCGDVLLYCYFILLVELIKCLFILRIEYCYYVIINEFLIIYLYVLVKIIIEFFLFIFVYLFRICIRYVFFIFVGIRI